MISQTQARQSFETRLDLELPRIVSCELLCGSCLASYGERPDPLLELVYLSERRATVSVEIGSAAVGQNGTILRNTPTPC
jgi:hypothetical protein